MIDRRCFLRLGGAALLGGGLLARRRAAYAATGLNDALAKIAAASGGRLGVAVLDVGSGESFGHLADERFPMCSTFKLLACAAVLSRVDAGTENLARRIRFAPTYLITYSPITERRTGDSGMTLGELCAAAVTLSDNTAANLILDSLGGPSVVTAYARSLGDAMTRLDRNEPSLNATTDERDTTTPRAMAGTLQTLCLGTALSQTSRDMLIGWMVGCKTGDARLRAGLPKEWRVGDKTGTWSSPGAATVNDIAVIWPPARPPLIVTAYLTGSSASPDHCNAALAAVASAVAAALGT